MKLSFQTRMQTKTLQPTLALKEVEIQREREGGAV